MISLDLTKSSEVRIAGDPDENIINKSTIHIDRSPAILTSDDFIRSNEIIRTKWPIYEVIRHFVLMI